MVAVPSREGSQDGWVLCHVRKASPHEDDSA